MNENLEKFKNFIATKDETLLDGQNSNIQDVEDKAFIMEYLRKSSRGTTTYNDLCDVRLIGERLHQVKKRRRQGQFIPWVRQEFFGVAGLR